MSLGLLLKHSDIFVMTPEILVNNININGLRLNHFSLMVFDECHHTRKSEVYNVLMLKYLNVKHRGAAHTRLPQVFHLENKRPIFCNLVVIIKFRYNNDIVFLNRVKYK